MRLKDLQWNWNEFGKTDFLWRKLTGKGERGNKWRINEFFKTGIIEIDKVIKQIKSLEIKLTYKRALDFGCGPGRLTQPLVKYFDEVHGVDISFSMIGRANKYNRHKNKCIYHANEKDNLRLFKENYFDFIYTTTTLENMEPKYAKRYIKEFLRILSPKGLLIFQIPSQKIKKYSKLKQAFKFVTPTFLHNLHGKIRSELFALQAKIRNIPRMEMYCIKYENLIKFVDKIGGKIIDLHKTKEREFINCYYYVMKK